MILKQNQIYILDDESGVRQSIGTILSAEDYDVKLFGSGRELLEHLEGLSTVVPAAALVDIRLPDINGVIVMKKIKEKSAETEVVMLTGHPDASSAIESLNAGAYAYVQKPYNMDEIKRILARIFERQKLVRENREMTQKLKEWNERLEEEVHRRIVALQESYSQLQSLYQMRTQFVTVMSHELRTPATALIGFADTLRQKWNELSREKIDEYLSIISEESNRMVLLMSEIFEVSRIQEKKLELNPQPVDFAACITAIVDEFRSRYPHCSFRLTKRFNSGRLKADAVYFRSALSHVLMNAVKYAPPKSDVLVLAEEREREFYIRVEDEGPGVPHELQEKVFEPFFRSIDDVNRRTPGVGLGLTIARGIVDAMRGNIHLTERSDGKPGCAAVLTLPLS